MSNKIAREILKDRAQYSLTRQFRVSFLKGQVSSTNDTCKLTPADGKRALQKMDGKLPVQLYITEQQR
jgi:hypothetical protein